MGHVASTQITLMYMCQAQKECSKGDFREGRDSLLGQVVFRISLKNGQDFKVLDRMGKNISEEEIV